MRGLGGRESAERAARRIFRDLDVNGDGLLSESEFVGARDAPVIMDLLQGGGTWRLDVIRAAASIWTRDEFSKRRKAWFLIGLYRDVWIAAIASSTTSLATRTAAICVRFQGRRVRRVYVTMQITFLTRKSALIYRRGLRQRVASLTLNCNGDFAIRAYSLVSNRTNQ